MRGLIYLLSCVLAALTVGCAPADAGTVLPTESWTVVLQQERGGKEGRVYLFLDLHRAPYTDARVCAGDLAHVMGTVTARKSRVQTAGTGTVEGFWNRCTGLELTITVGVETFHLRASTQAPVSSGTESSWVAGARSGTFTMRQGGDTGWNPDSHFDVVIINNDSDKRYFSSFSPFEWPARPLGWNESDNFAVEGNTSRTGTLRRYDANFETRRDFVTSYEMNAADWDPFTATERITTHCIFDQDTGDEVLLILDSMSSLRCGDGWRVAVPDFGIALDDAALPTQGGSLATTIRVQSLADFHNEVSLSVEGLPEGVTAGLGASTIRPPGHTSLTLAVSEDVPAGTYPLTVRGTAGISRTAGLTLSVRRTSSAPTAQPRLTVRLAGDGAGSVRSDPSGIDCGATCSATFPRGTSITLTASPTAGASVQFSGSCRAPESGSVRASLTLDSDAVCTVTFTKPQQSQYFIFLNTPNITITTSSVFTMGPEVWDQASSRFVDAKTAFPELTTCTWSITPPGGATNTFTNDCSKLLFGPSSVSPHTVLSAGMYSVTVTASSATGAASNRATAAFQVH